MPLEAFKKAATIKQSMVRDGVIIEHGFDLGHLGVGIKHYNLEEEVNQFRTQHIAAQKAKDDALFQQAQPSDDIKASLLADAATLGAATISQSDGTMEFQYFLETKKLVTRYVF